MRLLDVAVPVPGMGSLTYKLPDELRDPPIGARVLVPLGNRLLTGVVCALRQEPEAAEEHGQHAARERDRDTGEQSTQLSRTGAAEERLKDVTDVLETEAFLPRDVVDLARWVADYYACGVGEAIAAAMPPRAWIETVRTVRITEAGEARLLTERGVRRDLLEQLTGGRVARVSQLAKRSRGIHGALMALEADRLVTLTQPLRGQADAQRTIRVAALTAEGHDSIGEAVRLGTRQRAALDLLRGSPDGIPIGALVEQGISADSITRLARLGLVAIERRRVERDPFASAITAALHPRNLHLTAEQCGALSRLRSLAATGHFQPALLHGVTGSGKTEIYLRLARDVRESGRGVLLLVPEIALTPAAAAVFRDAFGSHVAIQHSGLSDGERYDQWQRIRRGDVNVVVGTRSAVFAPLARIGLIVVDEEHDASYKQQESPRYHARDVAVVRARNANALIVLGSATPSMETYHNATNDRYTLVTMEHRVLDRPLASVRIVDMRPEFAAQGPDTVLSDALKEALTLRLERREQAIVLLNRRGFATAVFCRQCGETLDCPNCSVSLTVHRAAGRARCHYCSYSTRLPKACVKCAGPYLEQLGFGTERVEAEIAAAFPTARIGRVDRDTIRGRGAIAGILSRFSSRELDVLVGTQMIAKGHDFPEVTLVGVVSADVGLGLADFRAAERTFQLLTQVAGRSGRGERAGEAIVQTLYPDHYSIRHACRQDYRAFFADELGYRQAMRYPPAIALLNVVVKARTRERALSDAAEIVSALRLNGSGLYRVLGPAPAPLGRLKGEYRAQLFMKGTQRTAMRKALLAILAERPELKRRAIVDVDPISML